MPTASSVKQRRRKPSMVSKFTWEGLQNAIGLIVLKVTKATKSGDVYHWKHVNGLTLGDYIFVPQGANETFINHERGHQRQSRILGPLYLFVIGLPSFLWAAFGDGFRRKHGWSYYDFYTERWADQLGGVKR